MAHYVPQTHLLQLALARVLLSVVQGKGTCSYVTEISAGGGFILVGGLAVELSDREGQVVVDPA